MQLIVIRHAIARPRDAGRWREDGERPLSKPGVRRFTRVALAIRRWVDAPDSLFTSPLLRARQTADILHDSAGWPEPAVLPALAPDVPLPTVLAALARIDDLRVALVGHEPSLGVLVMTLIGAGRSGPGAPPHWREQQASRLLLKKGALAELQFAGPASAGQGRLAMLLQPKILRALPVRRRAAPGHRGKPGR